MKVNISKLSVAVIAAMSLSACGGHSHSNANNNQNIEDEAVFFDVQVVDGSLENACGFVDLNLNYQQDAGEPLACTDYLGKARFEVKKSSLKMENGADRSRLKLIFEAKKGSTINHLFGQKQGFIRRSKKFWAHIPSQERMCAADM